MRVRQLIDGASFGPEALKASGEAFDAAWAEIAGNFGNVPIDIDNARYRLASALLSVASEDSRDVEILKRTAIQAMMPRYRERTRGANTRRKRNRLPQDARDLRKI
jgi:hypothetical protein